MLSLTILTQSSALTLKEAVYGAEPRKMTVLFHCHMSWLFKAKKKQCKFQHNHKIIILQIFYHNSFPYRLNNYKLINKIVIKNINQDFNLNIYL